MKIVSHLVAFVILVLICWVLYLGISEYMRHENTKIDTAISQAYKTSKCIITKEDFSKGHSVYYQFKFNDKTYGGWIEDYNKKIRKGETYIVEFDSTDPKFNRIVK